MGDTQTALGGTCRHEGRAQQYVPPSKAAHCTSKKSSPSLCTTLPWRQRLRNHLSFMKSKRKLCLNCCDSCTSRFFSWLQNFCSSRLCRFRLCSSNSRRSRAFWWSSFSCGEMSGSRTGAGGSDVMPPPQALG